MAVSYQIFPEDRLRKRDPAVSVEIDKIDANDGTPVIDIKSYNPKNKATPPFRIPEWARVGKESC